MKKETEKKPFNTELDRDCFTFSYIVEVLNKNKTIYKTVEFGESFDKWEIYKHLKEGYPKKLFTIRLKI